MEKKVKTFDLLTDGEIDLVLEQKISADNIKDFVPAYFYKVIIHESKLEVGKAVIRIGNNDNIKYAGHIGYEINEEYRGKNYATKACKIIKTVALEHGLESLIITCNPENQPSRKTCEKIGAKYIQTLELPPYNIMYKAGQRLISIYEWKLD